MTPPYRHKCSRRLRAMNHLFCDGKIRSRFPVYIVVHIYIHLYVSISTHI